LGERLNAIQRGNGSTPLISTQKPWNQYGFRAFGFFLAQKSALLGLPAIILEHLKQLEYNGFYSLMPIHP